MTRFAFVPFLLALWLAGCGSTNVEGPKAYRAWCQFEDRPLGPWLDSREEAERIRAEHKRRQPWHQVIIRVVAQADVKDRMRKTGGG